MRFAVPLICLSLAAACAPSQDTFGRPLHPIFEHDSLPVAVASASRSRA